MRRKARAQTLDLALGLEHIDQLVGADLGDDAAAARNELDEPTRAQLAQRLADGRPRDAKLHSETLLIQPMAGRQFADDDLVGQAFVDLRPQASCPLRRAPSTFFRAIGSPPVLPFESSRGFCIT